MSNRTQATSATVEHADVNTIYTGLISRHNALIAEREKFPMWWAIFGVTMCAFYVGGNIADISRPEYVALKRAIPHVLFWVTVGFIGIDEIKIRELKTVVADGKALESVSGTFSKQSRVRLMGLSVPEWFYIAFGIVGSCYMIANQYFNFHAIVFGHLLGR